MACTDHQPSRHHLPERLRRSSTTSSFSTTGHLGIQVSLHHAARPPGHRQLCAIDSAPGAARWLLTSVLLHVRHAAVSSSGTWRLMAVDADSNQPRVHIVAFVAALFAVAMVTEAVFISGRSEILCATFFLALLCARR